MPMSFGSRSAIGVSDGSVETGGGERCESLCRMFGTAGGERGSSVRSSVMRCERVVRRVHHWDLGSRCENMLVGRVEAGGDGGRDESVAWVVASSERCGRRKGRDRSEQAARMRSGKGRKKLAPAA